MDASAGQEQLLRKTLQLYTAACNFVSKYVYATHDLSEKTLRESLYGRLRRRQL